MEWIESEIKEKLNFILAGLLIVCLVGLGLHLLHKKALAVTNYICWVIEVDDEAEDIGPLAGLDVEMNFDGAGWVDAVEVLAGKYVITQQNLAVEWKIRYTDDLEPVDPNANPTTQAGTSFEWRVREN